ncbi:hypothetical protein UC34_18110 [Pandoraea vervacti]|uniref:Uncharacterized protein n=1 Tax=Pandoraea vervacti TaxID=656178 RepID=A0ABN4FUC3_9BURK|nr:hypothetical protein [Pandoraea vervacti]AJP58357.1 hypothetical protein UC34_18110 [Pandoraea vervacti]
MLSFAFYGTFHGTLHGASYAWSNTWRDVGGPYGWYVGLACIAALAAYFAREPWRLLNPNDAHDDIETFYMRRYPDLFDESRRVRGHTVV